LCCHNTREVDEEATVSDVRRGFAQHHDGRNGVYCKQPSKCDIIEVCNAAECDDASRINDPIERRDRSKSRLERGMVSDVSQRVLRDARTIEPLVITDNC